MAFRDYSLTPADNTQIGEDIYVGPNMFRNHVRDAIQQLAADGRELADELAAGGGGGGGGTGDNGLRTDLNAANGANLVRTIATGTGAVARSVREKGRDTVSVKDFGAVGDGTTVDTAAIQAAINAVSASGGGTVTLPKGAYRTGTLTLPQDVFLDGAGKYNTRLVATAGLNAPLIDRGGTLANIVNRGGVRKMAIVGSGKANTGMIGLRSTYTNRAVYEDIDFFGCYIGLFFQNVWQDQWVNLHVHGGGTDASYVGFWGGVKDPTVGISNAVNAYNCIAQGVEKYGFRLENCNGSKFTSCEAMDGEIGWYIGGPGSGTEVAQFGHFVNCLGDSNGQYNWRIEGGNSTVRRMLFCGIWAGTAGLANIYCSTASELLFTGCQLVASVGHGIRFFNSSRSTVVGCNINDFNKNSGANHGIFLENAEAITVTGNQINTLTQGTGNSVKELGSANRNMVTSNFNATPMDLIGAQTVTANNITF